MLPALFDCNAAAAGPGRYHSHAAAAVLCVVDSHCVCGSQVSGFNIGIEQEGPEGAEYINLPVPDQSETCMSVDADGVHSLSTDTVDHASA